jgi:hypothetical protein
LAEIVGKYVAKGSRVYVEGKAPDHKLGGLAERGEETPQLKSSPATCYCSAPAKTAAAIGNGRLTTRMRTSLLTLAPAKLWTRIFHSEIVWEIPAHPYEGRAVMSPTNGHANNPYFHHGSAADWNTG